MTLSLGGACKDAERDLVSLGVRLATGSAAISTSLSRFSSTIEGGGGDCECLMLVAEAVGDSGGGA